MADYISQTNNLSHPTKRDTLCLGRAHGQAEEEVRTGAIRHFEQVSEARIIIKASVWLKRYRALPGKEMRHGIFSLCQHAGLRPAGLHRLAGFLESG